MKFSINNSYPRKVHPVNNLITCKWNKSCSSKATKIMKYIHKCKHTANEIIIKYYQFLNVPKIKCFQICSKTFWLPKIKRFVEIKAVNYFFNEFNSISGSRSYLFNCLNSQFTPWSSSIVLFSQFMILGIVLFWFFMINKTLNLINPWNEVRMSSKCWTLAIILFSIVNTFTKSLLLSFHYGNG